MVKFLAPLALATAALASPSVYDPKWTAYKQKFNKQYTAEEDVTRYNIYLQTMEEINEHNTRANAGLETFFQGETVHTDMTHDEVNKKNGWGKPFETQSEIVYEKVRLLKPNNELITLIVPKNTDPQKIAEILKNNK